MSSSNKTIAKNTMFLYIRMFFNMAVSLYTSRIVLRVLGVEDFGIYSLVAGVVVLFSFLNNSMTTATQRYINVEKVTENSERIRKIFNISLFNHFLIAFLVLILAETVGIWFLNSKLNIPESRMSATNIVYQMSVITVMIDVVRVPFNGMIVAYEKMSFYAWLGISETIAKLLVVFLLLSLPSDTDKLIFYGIFIVGVNFLSLAIYYFYCRKKFSKETQFKLYRDFQKIRELLTFSGWMLLGQVAAVGANQGLSMIVNIFYGVVLNAAIGIANQVDGAVYRFVSNFQIAFNPQIVQTYANGDLERNKKLILATSKFSFFLMSVLSLPVLYFTHSLLVLWLGNDLPKYVESLVKIVVFCSLINAMAASFWMSAASIGANKVKEYNIILTIINFFTFPLAYLLLSLGFSPVYVFIAKFFIYFILQLFRWYFIDKFLNFKRKDFWLYIWGISVIFMFLLAVVYFSDDTLKYSFFEMFWRTILFEIGLIILIVSIGLRKAEKAMIFNFVKNKLNSTYKL